MSPYPRWRFKVSAALHFRVKSCWASSGAGQNQKPAFTSLDRQPAMLLLLACRWCCCRAVAAAAAVAVADVLLRRNKCSTCSFCVQFSRNSSANGSSKTENAHVLGQKAGEKRRKVCAESAKLDLRKTLKDLAGECVLENGNQLLAFGFFHFQRKPTRTRNGL